MKRIRLLTFGSPDVSKLEATDIKNNFFIAIELYFGVSFKDGVTIFCFFLCDLEGLKRYIEYEFKYEKYVDLEHIVVVQEYDYGFILNYLDNIESKLKELKSENDIWEYLKTNFILCDD
jgi:hypothetical protein